MQANACLWSTIISQSRHFCVSAAIPALYCLGLHVVYGGSQIPRDRHRTLQAAAVGAALGHAKRFADRKEQHVVVVDETDVIDWDTIRVEAERRPVHAKPLTRHVEQSGHRDLLLKIERPATARIVLPVSKDARATPLVQPRGDGEPDGCAEHPSGRARDPAAKRVRAMSATHGSVSSPRVRSHHVSVR